MNRLFLGVLSFFLFISCKNNVKETTNVSIEIKKIDIPKTSIRALVSIDENNMFFAGSNGNYGFYKDGEVTVKKITYKDSINPNFRSAAFNGKDYFMLSIESPALLYKVADSVPQIVYKEEGKGVFYDSMKFFDEKNGIAFGDPVDGCMSVITTQDGGNTWNKINCDQFPKSGKQEGAFAASNTNISIVDSTAWLVSGGLTSRIYKTSNFGKSWNYYDTPVLKDKTTEGIYSVDFYNENLGIVIGGDYTLTNHNFNNKAITKDGGKTWQIIANGTDPGYQSCVQFVPNKDGKEIMSVGKTGLYYSSNTGGNWQKISNEGYYALQFVNQHTAWVTGDNKIGFIKLIN